MSKKSWKDQYLYLVRLIFGISDFYGGDTKEKVEEYADDCVKRYKFHLEEPIKYFEWLHSRLNLSLREEEIKSLKTHLCDVCYKMPPFCYHGMDKQHACST